MDDQLKALGKYRIINELGRGGFATVYRAEDTTLGREVALKVLDPLLMRDTTWVQRFREEARAVAALDHPRIVTIHEIAEVSNRLFIAMKLIEGPSLDFPLADRGALPWDEARRIILEIGEALDYAHGKGILHRDLKPGNVLLDPRMGAILTDFGFARMVTKNSLSVSLSGGLVGTPHYMAPELWHGRPGSFATDIYALGCMLYEMVLGCKAFPGDTPPAVMTAHLLQSPALPELWPEGVPPDVGEVLKAALAREPEKRTASVSAFLVALGGLAVDPLAEAYAALEAAVAAEQWEDALRRAEEVRAHDPGYRELGALTRKAEAGLALAQRAQLALQWQEQARAAEAAGEWGLAEAAVAQWLTLLPDDVEPQALQWRMAAEIALARGELDRASSAWNRWQRLAPEDAALGVLRERLWVATEAARQGGVRREATEQQRRRAETVTPAVALSPASEDGDAPVNAASSVGAPVLAERGIGGGAFAWLAPSLAAVALLAIALLVREGLRLSQWLPARVAAAPTEIPSATRGVTPKPSSTPWSELALFTPTSALTEIPSATRGVTPKPSSTPWSERALFTPTSALTEIPSATRGVTPKPSSTPWSERALFTPTSALTEIPTATLPATFRPTATSTLPATFGPIATATLPATFRPTATVTLPPTSVIDAAVLSPTPIAASSSTNWVQFAPLRYGTTLRLSESTELTNGSVVNRSGYLTWRITSVAPTRSSGAWHTGVDVGILVVQGDLRDYVQPNPSTKGCFHEPGDFWRPARLWVSNHVCDPSNQSKSDEIWLHMYNLPAFAVGEVQVTPSLRLWRRDFINGQWVDGLDDHWESGPSLTIRIQP